MTMVSEYALYLFVIGYAFYGILLVPYFCSKRLVEFGNDERFWFVVIVCFNIFALAYLLISERYRSKLSNRTKTVFLLFMIGYGAFLSVIFKF
jgi:hypothetical protein